MARLGLETEIVDQKTLDRTRELFRSAKIRLPKFSELAQPETIPKGVIEQLTNVDPDTPDWRNLFRVHWFNDAERKGLASVPGFVELPPELTGTEARIVVMLGSRFPMIRAHKVLAAYGCLVPRLVTGQFDPTAHRAVWPSTGNYCRGGVAISRILGCRGVAVLPEGMSQERFDWLDAWVADPADVVKTFGSESNVKEIYDKCAELDRDPTQIIFNQFCEFGNHLVHYAVTGRAAESVFLELKKGAPDLKLNSLVSATGSAGTIAAGDYLKDGFGSTTVAVEALECPTLLYNGFGEHNIQGIGDKHIPLIHNVMATDYVTGVSDESCDSLNLLFNTASGREYLESRTGLNAQTVGLSELGLSSLCNVIASIKTAKYQGLGPNDVVMTVATDSAAMYRTEQSKAVGKYFPKGFAELEAAEVFGQHLKGITTDHFQELSIRDRESIFNLGYFTWVEQQNVSLDDFVARREQSYWCGLRPLLNEWDSMIDRFNQETGCGV